MGIFARPPPASKLMTTWVGGAFGQPNNVSEGSPRNPREVLTGSCRSSSFEETGAVASSSLSSDASACISASRAARLASSRNRWAPLMRPQFPKGAVDGLEAHVLATPSDLRRISPNSFFQFQGLAALRAAAMRCLGRAGFFFFLRRPRRVPRLRLPRRRTRHLHRVLRPACASSRSILRTAPTVYKRLMQVLPLLFLGPLHLAPTPAVSEQPSDTPRRAPRPPIEHKQASTCRPHLFLCLFSSTRRTCRPSLVTRL